jgi:Tfp pilus assembly protein PilF
MAPPVAATKSRYPLMPVGANVPPPSRTNQRPPGEQKAMNNGKHSGSRAGRLLTALAVPTIVLLGSTACSGNDPAAGNHSATVAPDAKKALAALNAGLKAHAAGHLVTAAADYNTTLKYDPTNKFAFYNLALIDEANGNYGLANDKYRTALKTDPAYEPALFNLAILRTGPNPKEAISLYKRAVAADKKDAAAWLNLGLLLRANGQERAGDKDVLRAIGLDPTLKDPTHRLPRETAPTSR